MKQTSTNGWQMSSSEKAEVQATGLLMGRKVDLTRLIWVEVQVGIWNCWFASA